MGLPSRLVAYRISRGQPHFTYVNGWAIYTLYVYKINSNLCDLVFTKGVKPFEVSFFTYGEDIHAKITPGSIERRAHATGLVCGGGGGGVRAI